MPTRGAGFWAGVTIIVLALAFGAWKASAPAARHPSIITVERTGL